MLPLFFLSVQILVGTRLGLVGTTQPALLSRDRNSASWVN